VLYNFYLVIQRRTSKTKSILTLLGGIHPLL